MGIFTPVCKLFEYQELYDAACADSARRAEVRKTLATEAGKGDFIAAIFAGDVAAIDPCDMDSALYWFSLAARFGETEEQVRTVATRATQLAIFLARQMEPDYHGPATLRAMGWASIRGATGGHELAEHEWADLFARTGFDIEAVKGEARRILGAPPGPHRLN